jgi:hypothetical protein
MANMKSLKLIWLLAGIGLAVTLDLLGNYAFASPSAETARKCMRYSYLVYPYKRPGSVRGSGDRQAYFRECMAKDGNVPEPLPPNG